MPLECSFIFPQKFAILLSVLRVRSEPEKWVWHLSDQRSGIDLYRGTEPNRISAQVSAQVAYERWLERTGKEFGLSNPEVYDWVEID
jgi:hypothetical protein